MTKATFNETDELLGRLQEALEFMNQFDFHRERFEEAGFEPGNVNSLETFRELPLMTTEDLANDFKRNPPFGSLIPEGQRVVRSHFTPSPYFESMQPVPRTERDLELTAEYRAEQFRQMGLSEDDIVLNVNSFSPYPGGWSGGQAIEEIGAVHLPTGPGNTDDQVEIIDDFDVTVIHGMPSFLEKIADQADPAVLESVELLIAMGEPFTAIDGYREEVIEAYGGDVVATDYYGLAEFSAGAVGYETSAMNGMRIPEETVLVEVIDPDTGELVERGEKGEIVITSLERFSRPVARMRTGDLSILDEQDGNYVLPKGVLGIVGNKVKLKGVKVYPMEIQMFLAGKTHVDASNVQFRLSRPTGGTDRLAIVVNADPEQVDAEELRDEIGSIANVAVDEIILDNDFENEGDTVVDKRS